MRQNDNANVNVLYDKGIGTTHPMSPTISQCVFYGQTEKKTIIIISKKIKTLHSLWQKQIVMYVE